MDIFVPQLRTLIVTFAEDSDIVNLHNWAQGSFSGITWEQTELIAAVILVTFLDHFFPV